MDARKAAEEHEDLLKNRLREAMGDAAVLLAPGARITNRNSAPSPHWKDIAERIGRVAKSRTLRNTGWRDLAGCVRPRKFLATFNEEEE